MLVGHSGRSAGVGKWLGPTIGLNKAEQELFCDVDGKTNDCQVVTSGLGCLSIADSGDGKTVTGRTAFTQDVERPARLQLTSPLLRCDRRGDLFGDVVQQLRKQTAVLRSTEAEFDEWDGDRPGGDFRLSPESVAAG